MKNHDSLGSLALALLLAAGPVALVACDSAVGGNRGEDGADGADGEDGELPQPTSAAEIDVLLVIDGSGSMADKQGFLAETMRPFLERLRNPRCIDGRGDAVVPQLAPGEVCAEGSVREYTPDVTVHVGVVSSSLGASQDLCNGSMPGGFDDDGGRLLSRDPDGGQVPSYADLGFFAWDPAQRLAPAGEADFDAFVGKVEEVIRGVGETGCGFEMPLEAMYRFLADPIPGVNVDEGQEEGQVDEVVLQQRAAFLRPDSVLSVILLSDENDASLLPWARSFVGTLGNPMPRPRAECASDPGDSCCVSCIEPVPAGCSGDGGCAAPGDPGDPGNFHEQGAQENEINTRIWDSKRRFGLEVLSPVERYLEALSSATLHFEDGTTAPNPVFADGRDPRQVLYTAVVGVPWQDVARDPNDITQGFQSPSELRDRGTWGVILGDPQSYLPASDPMMVESTLPRSGVIPATGEVASEPNRINGGDRSTGGNDLQYACIFNLPFEDQRDCEVVHEGVNCDCRSGLENPLCVEDASGEPDVQVRAKAYPGLRQLDLAERLGDQARVVSMCGFLLDPGAPDPGSLGTLGIGIGLGEAADDVASRMSP